VHVKTWKNLQPKNCYTLGGSVGTLPTTWLCLALTSPSKFRMVLN
jgi:hypothetical protein